MLTPVATEAPPSSDTPYSRSNYKWHLSEVNSITYIEKSSL